MGYGSRSDRTWSNLLRRRALRMPCLSDDLRIALRGLIGARVTSGAAIACFSLGIGANIVVFGALDTLLWRAPSGVVAPRQVSRLYFTTTAPGERARTRTQVTISEYARIEQSVDSLGSVAAYWVSRVPAGRGAEAERIWAGVASNRFLQLLGVRPALGRFFGPGSDSAGALPEAVVSHGYWTRRYGRDSSALGRTIVLRDAAYQIVGVASRGFYGIDNQAIDVWLPLGSGGPALFGLDALTPLNAWLTPIVRLQSDYARARVGAVAATTLQAERPIVGARLPVRVQLGPVQGAMAPRLGRDVMLVVWLGIVSLMVLLIAVANVANLQIARTLARGRELAIRAALGATRWHTARLCTVEALLLAAAGGMAALSVAAAISRPIEALLLGGHSSPAYALSRIACVTALLTLLAGLGSAMPAVLQAWRSDLAAAIAVGGGTERRGPSRLRASLVVVQIGVTMILLMVAATFLRGLNQALRRDLGFDASRLVAVSLDMRAETPRETAQAATFYRRLLEELRATPGVAEASLSIGAPFYAALGTSVTAAGSETENTAGPPQMAYYVSADFFSTLQVRLDRGRGFTAAVDSRAPPEAVVNRALGEVLWPHEDPLGKCLVVRGEPSPCITVVGVCADIPMQVFGDAYPSIYLPLSPTEIGLDVMSVAVRTVARPSNAIPGLRRRIASAIPDLPFVDIAPYSDRIEAQLRPLRAGSLLVAVYAGLALVLTLLGVFGLLSSVVARRAREMGIRAALGAGPGAIRRLVLGEGLRLAAIGVAVGTIASLVVTRLVTSLLYGLSQPGALAYVAIGAALTCVALLACIAPSVRASGVDPVSVLRAD